MLLDTSNYAVIGFVSLLTLRFKSAQQAAWDLFRALVDHSPPTLLEHLIGAVQWACELPDVTLTIPWVELAVVFSSAPGVHFPQPALQALFWVAAGVWHILFFSYKLMCFVYRRCSEPTTRFVLCRVAGSKSSPTMHDRPAAADFAAQFDYVWAADNLFPAAQATP